MGAYPKTGHLLKFYHFQPVCLSSTTQTSKIYLFIFLGGGHLIEAGR